MYSVELKHAFVAFDRNEDGFIDSDDLGYVMGKLGHDLSNKEVKKLFKDICKQSKFISIFFYKYYFLNSSYRDSEILFLVIIVATLKLKKKTFQLINLKMVIFIIEK